MLSLHPKQLEFEPLEECGEGGGVFMGISATCKGSVYAGGRYFKGITRTPFKLTVLFKVPR
jgi:hypothetical protein